MTQTPPLIREPVIGGIANLHPVLERWSIHPETGATLPKEVEETELSIAASINGVTPQKFVVAEEMGIALGIMGIQPPGGKVLAFAETGRPVEVTTAMVSDKARGRGIGKKLLANLAERAASQGATELLVHSSIRYEESGWPFWVSQFGEHVGTIEGYALPGIIGRVWRKPITEIS